MFDFAEEGHNTQCPSNPTKYTASLLSESDQLLEWLTVADFDFCEFYNSHRREEKNI